jgi:hypothetical protein
MSAAGGYLLPVSFIDCLCGFPEKQNDKNVPTIYMELSERELKDMLPSQTWFASSPDGII